MIKRLALIFLLMLISLSAIFAQQNVSLLKSNSNRLYVDFEVKSNKNPDAQLLNSINLDDYESFRHANARVQVTDISTGFVLILYSQKETDANRGKKSPAQKFQESTDQHQKALN
ncbi:MAG: hypothetical protein ABI723_06955 [Bacteroidia bacterium]